MPGQYIYQVGALWSATLKRQAAAVRDAVDRAPVTVDPDTGRERDPRKRHAVALDSLGKYVEANGEKRYVVPHARPAISPRARHDLAMRFRRGGRSARGRK